MDIYNVRLFNLGFQNKNSYVANLNQLQSIFITLDFLILDFKIKILTLQI